MSNLCKRGCNQYLVSDYPGADLIEDNSYKTSDDILIFGTLMTYSARGNKRGKNEGDVK